MLALEVVSLPVTDIDRALAFYAERAGFILDVDYHQDTVETWACGWSTGLDPSVATIPASPISPTRTAPPRHCGSAVTARNERSTTMALSWQQGPLSGVSVGRFLTPEPLPKRLVYAEPLRRRLRVKLADAWIADSEDVLLLYEPGHYPVAFFPLADVRPGVLVSEKPNTRARDYGDTEWFTVTVGDRRATRSAWQYIAPPDYASELRGRVSFVWRAMDGFYEEDERIVGHAADPYHRNDIRQSSRHLVVMDGVRRIADTTRPIVLYESGFAPRWYVPRQDVDERALIPVEGQTFCPYKGLASYYDIGERKKAAWSYLKAWPEVARVSNFVSFEPDKIDVLLDDRKLALETGQGVKEHGIDPRLDPDDMQKRGNAAGHS